MRHHADSQHHLHVLRGFSFMIDDEALFSAEECLNDIELIAKNATFQT
jgi:hypothetical protein